MKADAKRKVGLGFVGDVPWGTHFCQFYETKEDLVEILVPYFAEGLRNNEFCMWVTSPPLEVEEAKTALGKIVPDIDEYIQKGQIEILSYTDWYLLGGEFDADRVLQGWIEKEKKALSRGFYGLRLTGNTFWIERSLWKSFANYEAAVNDVIVSHRMLAVCTYSLPKCTGSDVVDVVRNHVGTLIKRANEWCMVEDVRQRRETEEMHKIMLETSMDAFWVTNKEGRILEVNDAYCRLIGYRREELLSMRIQDLEVAETPEEIQQHMRKVIQEGTDRFETSHRRKDGKTLDVEVGINYFDVKGGMFFVFIHDITTRKARIGALTEAKDTLSLALKSVGGATWDLNVVDGIQVWSPETYELYGLDPSEPLTFEKSLSMVHPEDREALERSLADSYKNRDELWSMEFRIVNPKRGVRWVAASAKTIYDAAGRPIRTIGLDLDITKQKNIEQEIRSLAKFPSENPNAVIRIDLSGTVKYSNPAGRFLLNLWNCKVGERAPDRISQFVADALTSNKKIEFEETYGEQTFSYILAPITKEGYVNVYGIDITERKKAEQALLQAKRDWERTFDSVPDLIAILDNQHRIVRANRAMAHQLGVTPEQCVGLNCYECVHGTSQPIESCPHALTLQDGQEHTAEVHEDRLGGDFLVSTTPLKDEQGKMVGSVHVARNITERKRAEQALRESQKDLNRAQAVARTGSWRLDVRRDELLWSDESYRMFGIPKGTPLTYETFLSKVHSEDRAYVDQKWNAALRGDHYDIEHRIIVDGEVKWVREKAELEFDKDGLLLGGFGTVQEITEIKEMREKLEQYTKHLEKLVEERTEKLKEVERLATIGETAGMVGHDIRNPLQAIIGELYLSKDCLQSLPESDVKQDLKENISVIEEQALYINKIVTDLQDYAKPLAPCLEETDIKNIVESVLSSVDIPETIEVAYSVQDGFPKFMTDPSYMRRIFTNLVSNATQAMPNGGKLTISAFCKDQKAFVNVEDTGEGITEEAKSKMFKPLFTTKAKGQGFGLAVVKKLTEALGGSIRFESELKKGTRFILAFPANSNNHE